VIGFLGGFTKRNDVKHPEVLFTDYLNSRYGSALHAEVFGNHEGSRALDLIMKNIDNKNKDGPQVPADKKTTKIILYGHSWGASQVLTFARELETRGMPVALTIQVDSVRKMGQNDRTVPPNVARAVNFYQRKGFTPGRPLIVPADPERTTILGNFHMIYKDPNIRCDNYRWFSRVLNKPHHLIENDPHVWDQIVSLIDSELVRPNLAASQFQLEPQPLRFPISQLRRAIDSKTVSPTVTGCLRSLGGCSLLHTKQLGRNFCYRIIKGRPFGVGYEQRKHHRPTRRRHPYEL